MNWEWLLFGFRGRLARMPYWIGTAVSVLVMVVAFLLFVADTQSPWALAVFMLLVLIGSFIGIALSLKRLHDRNKSGWWLLIYLIAPAIFDFAARATGVEALYAIFVLASLGISVWALVDLGFVRGTRGVNRFGEDPLQGRAA